MKTAKLPPSRNGHLPKPLDGPIAEKSESEKARQVLEEDAKKRVAACVEELSGVLKKYNCTLGPEIIINGQPLLPEVRAKQ